jgi:CheY-like chemotaxis protein
LICDYRLVGEDGGQAIQKIRTEFNQEIPALLVTGDTSSECLHQMKATGCPVLHKPIRADDLKQEISRLLPNLSEAPIHAGSQGSASCNPHECLIL